MRNKPPFLAEIFEATNNANICDTFTIEDMAIQVWLAENRHIGWLSKYLSPLLNLDTPGTHNCKITYKVGSFFSDEIVSSVAQFIESGDRDYFKVWNGKRYVNRIPFSPTLLIDHDAEPGTVCAYDLEAKTITLVTSAHTELGMHELGRCIRDLVSSYMRSIGWNIFHAGGFQIDGKNYLVLGDKGAGKTSLIIAMLYAGANFIANDRVFIKKTDQGVLLKSFPMAVAVGLGTAMQYPQLKYFVSNPDSLTYPRRRMDRHKVNAYPESRWHELNDKLQLFPEELLQPFGAGELFQGGKIDGILFPAISDFQGATLKQATSDHAQRLINRACA